MESIPESAQPIVDELIVDKLLSESPSLTPGQWVAISGLANTFAEQGPNQNARHVRRKLAYFHMINDATHSQQSCQTNSY